MHNMDLFDEAQEAINQQFWANSNTIFEAKCVGKDGSLFLWYIKLTHRHLYAHVYVCVCILYFIIEGQALISCINYPVNGMSPQG